MFKTILKSNIQFATKNDEIYIKAIKEINKYIPFLPNIISFKFLYKFI